MSTIKWYTFYNCQNLESIYIPGSVTSIEDAAFYNCKNVKNIISKIRNPFPLNVSQWEEVFYGCYGATLYVPLSKKTLYENVAGWKKFKNIVEVDPEVGDEIEEIIDDINFICTIIDLEGKTCKLVHVLGNTSGEVTIPESVNGFKLVGIGSKAFADNRSITSIVIPNAVTFIESNAFNGCTNLIKINSKIVTPFAINSDAFHSETYNTATLVVPSDKIKEYQQTEGWKEFKTILDKNDGDTFKAYDNLSNEMVIEVISVIEKTCKLKSCFTTSNAINIPAIIRGFNIVEIEDGAITSLNFVQNIKLPEGIIKIGKNAFAFCKNLKIVNIPSTVTSIEGGAYEGCGLEAVVFNDIESWCKIKFEDKTSNPLYYAHHLYINNSNLQWYMNYTTEIRGDKVTNVTIPNSITEIGDYAFCSFSDLTNLNMSSSLTSIGCSAFDGCSNLETISFPNNVYLIAENAFRDCVNLNSISLPSGNLDIRKGAFLGCNKLLNVSLSSSLIAKDYTLGESLVDIFGVQVEKYIMSSDYERIGKYVFSNSSNLKLISLNQNKIASIGEGAFYGCSKIESLDIKNNVQTIEKNIVSGCTKLRSISLHKVGTIKNSAFSGCQNLENIEINDTINYIEKESFKDCVNLKKVIAPNLSAWCAIEFEDRTSNPINITKHLYQTPTTELTDLIIPNDVNEIKNYTFYGCSSLTSVSIPSCIKVITPTAFESCTNLVKLFIDSNDIASLGYSYNSPIFPDSPITDIVIGNFVTQYGEMFNRSTLRSIKIPSSVNELYSYSFSYCENIQTIDIDCKVINGGCFEDKKDLATVILGNNVETIDNTAFANCTALTSITLPKGIKKIGYSAFSGCQNLVSVNFEGNPFSIGRNAFTNCTSLSSVHVKDISAWCNIEFSNMDANPLSIAHHLYQDGKEILDLKIPSGIAVVKPYTFCGGSSIVSIEIPSSVTAIEIDAFKDCTNLNKIIISDLSVWCGINFGNGLYASSNPLSIAHHLYNTDGTEITDLVIPNGVESINSFAFNGGSNFTSVSIPNSIKNIGNSSFSGCNKLSKVIISDLSSWCSTNFGDNPLWYAQQLYTNDGSEIQDLTIPTGVGRISSSAFAGCSSLKSLVIPNDIEYIGDKAFAGCSSLATVVIPNSVKAIGYQTFADCMSLYSVTSLINIPFKLNETVFEYTGYEFDKDIMYNIAKLYVPTGRRTVYGKTTGWMKFGDNIVEIDTKFKLTYIVDGAEYKTYEIQATEVITPEPDPFVEGYIFSGWSTIPKVMPANDVTVYGNFTVDPDYTGVESIESNEINPKDYYTIDGRRHGSQQKGLNIIRMNDGSTKKIVVKKK